jgi:hypothetical protein
MKFRLEKLRDFAALVKELSIGLKNLSFNNNFTSFETTVTISATSEQDIVNELTIIPTKYIIVDQSGNGLITRGTTEWTRDKLYLYNNGAVSVTATVIFME